MKKEVQRLEEKYKDIAQLKTMKEQVEELKKERVWAEVIELEKVLCILLLLALLGPVHNNNNISILGKGVLCGFGRRPLYILAQI
jgi:hypothetical protein